MFRYVNYLKPGKTYRITVDLAGLAYHLTGRAKLERPLGDTLRNTILDSVDKGLHRLSFIPMLLTGSPQIDTLSTALPKFEVNLDRVRSFLVRDETQDPGDPLSYLDAHGGDAPFLFGRINPFAITASAKPGTTAIGIALWSVERGRPIDELSIPLCVAESEASCPAELKPVLSLGSGAVIDLAADGGAVSPIPDATLHIVQLESGSSARVEGIFAENSRGEPATEKDFTVWRVSDRPDEFVKHLQEHQDDFGSALAASKVGVGRAMMRLLFPSEQESAEVARNRFVNFMQAARGNSKPFAEDQPKRLFVRMILSSQPQPTLYPVGLLATGNRDDDFVGYHARIEVPLPRQRYASRSDCVSRWKPLLPLPQEMGEDGALKAAYAGISDRIDVGEFDLLPSYTLGAEKFPIFPDMQQFLHWIQPEIGTDGKPPPPAEPVLLAVLSHHDQESVFFDPRDKAHADNIEIQFKAPALAVLSTCSSAKVGASGFVAALNTSGVDAVIATNSAVEGDLAGDFIDCLAKVYETAATRTPIEFGDLFTGAQRCVYEKKNSAYGASVLSFSLAGNPSLKLCAARGKP